MNPNPFTPTHYLVSRAKKTPVQLIPSKQGFQIMTEIDWQKEREPLFEMRAKQGIFCQGVLVVGYSLKAIAPELESPASKETASV